MRQFRSQVLQKVLRLHGFLAVAAALFVLIFVLSGASHILMVWTGPKQTSFFPPQTAVEASALSAIPAILTAHQIDQAHLIKVVPTADGNALQITTDETAPRRYFDLETYQEWPDYDVQQAIWLARYYTGLETAEVVSTTWQTTFDAAYPAVNRLLPVYRIQFDTPDNRAAFIYTEIAALANLTNDWKTLLQAIFTNVHTLSWLENVELARVLILSLMVASLLGMLLSGMLMLLMMKSRTIRSASRRWHRRVAMGVCVPLFAFAFSGAYHLYQYAYGEPATGLQLAERFQVDETVFTADLAWLEQYEGIALNHVALVQGTDQQLLYRVSLPNHAAVHHAEHDHSARFDGLPSEQGAYYYPVQSNNAVALTDAEQAIFLASQYTRLDPSRVTFVSPVFGFSPEYDFRNKRLPVWRVDYTTDTRDSVFVDPATGMLVEKTRASQRIEAWVFAWLHKWNFMTPSLGMAGRDALMSFFLIMVFLLAVLGGMQYRQKRRKAS